MSTEIVLSLISHTNIGKTTLTRTLLRRDVGEVRDQAHVTEVSERFVLIRDGEDVLSIWDTPGFGPVQKLLTRLARENGAIGWIMNEVVDRVFNRGLYSSLEAARNVRREADVVLYLVNARERPEDAGYVRGELTLLDALGKPVVMILNQVPDEKIGDIDALTERWWETYRKYSCLRGVLMLDAFLRSWYQELRLLDAVAPCLDDQKRAVLQKLRDRYLDERQKLFRECARFAAETLWFAVHQRGEGDEKRSEKVFERMFRDLQNRLDDYLELLISQHGLRAKGRARLEADIEEMTGLVGKRLSEEKTGLMTGAVTSAGTGLMADILAGGLTLGGGMLLGFLGGYLGGFSFARIKNLFQGKGTAKWERDALFRFYEVMLSYYLLAALHGRGKGDLELGERVPFLVDAVASLEKQFRAEVHGLVEDAVGIQKLDATWLESFERLFERHVNQVSGHLGLQGER